MSIVSHVKLKERSKQELLGNIRKAMEIAEWKKHINGRTVFIKLNLLSDQLVPGQCTSPWVLEGVLKVLTENGFSVVVGDADVATSRQAEPAAYRWGILDVCAKYGAQFVNLSKQETVTIPVNGEVWKEIPVPKIICESDARITLPVIKTHNVTTMTCALKNQWGCIPRFRHQFHGVA